MKLAVSDKADIRDAITQMVNNTTFITGDLKLYKELSAVKQAVLQRDQTEKSFKNKLFVGEFLLP